MSAIFRPAESNRASYYDVRYKEKDTGKWKHAKFATNMYGKYTKEIAEYAVTNGVRLNNWFEEKEEWIINCISNHDSSFVWATHISNCYP